MKVHVLDSSTIVNLKSEIPVGKQWEFFKRLEAKVDAGEVAIAKSVIREVSDVQHPDMPGAWARGMQDRMQHPLEPDPASVAAVMAKAPEVVDQSSDREEADPEVIGLALDMIAAGHDVVVVTDDAVDRMPIKIAMTTACGRCGVQCMSTTEFLDLMAAPEDGLDDPRDNEGLEDDAGL
ncbi:DUF4411 family protein (plasmid) [Iamia sp. SCSIO 61187]|uniref:DUF4411 family protein n=1 Tax=Iamia sp. SCSIO 61187 TaxID=2722752 RepID=UPI001C631B46|nr:DUF4411 family protein [Iamia sp. SCSIO 61187]QYG94372.1 DUF4411 family protein [Iamia sp. SCSIO 61187]QYG95813.1 DUF4411 family protein [Iamia sp. SCSIO 61187]